MKYLVIICCVLLFNSGFSQNYEDSIRQLRVLHFAELTDTSNHILTQDEIDHFQGLDYFLIDTNYRLTVRFEKNKGKKFEMPTSTERKPMYRRYGYIYFELNGKNHRLTLYQNLDLLKDKNYKDYLFLPFKDETTGSETYGAGRYIDLLKPSNNKSTIQIDFNLSYNPYCAYSHRYSCPITPDENKLKTSIKAGEKNAKFSPNYDSH